MEPLARRRVSRLVLLLGAILLLLAAASFFALSNRFVILGHATQGGDTICFFSLCDASPDQWRELESLVSKAHQGELTDSEFGRSLAAVVPQPAFCAKVSSGGRFRAVVRGPQLVWYYPPGIGWYAGIIPSRRVFTRIEIRDDDLIARPRYRGVLDPLGASPSPL